MIRTACTVFRTFLMTPQKFANDLIINGALVKSYQQKLLPNPHR